MLVSARKEGALAAAAALGSVGRLAGHAAGLGMLAGGTTRSINAFSTWSISVLPPSIATEHICPVFVLDYLMDQPLHPCLYTRTPLAASCRPADAQNTAA